MCGGSEARFFIYYDTHPTIYKLSHPFFLHPPLSTIVTPFLLFHLKTEWHRDPHFFGVQIARSHSKEYVHAARYVCCYVFLFFILAASLGYRNSKHTLSRIFNFAS